MLGIVGSALTMVRIHHSEETLGALYPRQPRNGSVDLDLLLSWQLSLRITRLFNSDARGATSGSLGVPEALRRRNQPSSLVCRDSLRFNVGDDKCQIVVVPHRGSNFWPVMARGCRSQNWPVSTMGAWSARCGSNRGCAGSPRTRSRLRRLLWLCVWKWPGHRDGNRSAGI